MKVLGYLSFFVIGVPLLSNASTVVENLKDESTLGKPFNKKYIEKNIKQPQKKELENGDNLDFLESLALAEAKRLLDKELQQEDQYEYPLRVTELFK